MPARFPGPGDGKWEFTYPAHRGGTAVLTGKPKYKDVGSVWGRRVAFYKQNSKAILVTRGWK